MRIIRSFKTLIRIAKKSPRQAWDLMQLRFEEKIGISLHWIDPLRYKVRKFEIKNTIFNNGQLIPYGNYYLDPNLMSNGLSVFSIGIGEDIDFDRALLSNHDVDLHMFDPTPRSKEFVSKSNIANKAKFELLAISNLDGEITLYVDDLENSFDTTTSVSIRNRSLHDGGFTVPCKRIFTLMMERGMRKLDVLKIDVEGAAIIIINDMLDSQIIPKQIAAEFERPISSRQVESYIKELSDLFSRLKSLGYKIYRTRPDCKGFQVEVTAVRQR